ncbi:MAG TPA: hypothetical protein VGE62_01325 [Candidatus Paceibacterota bacterium]
MAIVFEEEQHEIEKDQEIAEAREAVSASLGKVKQSVWEKVALVLFAVACLAGAVAIQLYYNPEAAAGLNRVYREDVSEQDLRLIPPADREAYLNSLPTRK